MMTRMFGFCCCCAIAVVPVITTAVRASSDRLIAIATLITSSHPEGRVGPSQPALPLNTRRLRGLCIFGRFNRREAEVRSGSKNEPAYAGARCARDGVRGNDG